MDGKKELISVVIPTYNRRQYIMGAINSVLDQDTSFFDFEIIVYDDGSTDKTYELFKDSKEPRIKYFLAKENKGVNVARNMGIKNARGDYILFLDSDDILVMNAFKVIEGFHSKLMEINLFGTAQMINKKKMYVIAENRNYTYQEWLAKVKINGEFLSLVKKSVFEQDMFDEHRFAFESFFWDRVIKKYGVFAADVVLRLYSFEDVGRISRELVKPEKAQKRFEDYRQYLDQFGQEYVLLDLPKQYAELLFKLGWYGILSGHGKEGRKYFTQSMKYKFKVKTLFFFLVSFFGTNFTVKSYKFASKFIKA